MQKIFRVRNSGATDGQTDLAVVNTFIGVTGKILSVTACKPVDEEREIGSWLVVADDGKEYTVKNPLD